MVDRDKALETALELLDGVICEYGHVVAEHHMTLDERVPQSCAECDCADFDAVDFFVQRASVRSDCGGG